MPPAGYETAIASVALFDVSATGKLLVTGPDAPQFLHNISTNDIKSLPLGGGCETFFCDARAKALFRVIVYHVKHAGRNALWLDAGPGRAEALLKQLDRFLIAEAVELADVTSRFAMLHLAGPTAAQSLGAALGEPVPDLNEFQHMERTLGGTVCSIRRHDPLGLPGFDIAFVAEKIDAVKRALNVPLTGAEAYEVLRVEAGTPLEGIDFDDSRFVMEIGRATRAVSYAKGCFPGQEPIVMARDRAGRVNRAFVGFKVAGQVPVGTKLTRDGQEVGLVTSVVKSPRLGGPLAIGYVHWKSNEPGLMLAAGETTVTVLGYPPVAGGS